MLAKFCTDLHTQASQGGAEWHTGVIKLKYYITNIHELIVDAKISNYETDIEFQTPANILQYNFPPKKATICSKLTNHLSIIEISRSISYVACCIIITRYVFIHLRFESRIWKLSEDSCRHRFSNQQATKPNQHINQWFISSGVVLLI